MADVATQIREQIEFYFSDSNWRRDKHLRKVADAAKDGFVPVSELLKFNRLNALTTDAAAVVDALKGSDAVVVGEDGLGVKRAKPLPEVDDSKARTIFVKTFPSDTVWEKVRDLFKQFGPVAFVRLRRDRTRKFDGTCFVEFASEGSAEKAIAAAAEGGAGVEFKEGEKLAVTSLAEFIKVNAAEKKAAAAAAKAKAQEQAKKEEEKRELIPNLIVRVSNLPVGGDLMALKESLKEHGKLAYLELDAAKEGEDAPTTGLARFKSAEDQAEFVEKCAAGSVEVDGAKIAAVLVQGDEEKQYWERMWAARHSDGRRGRHNKGRGNRGGRKRSRDDNGSDGGDAKVAKPTTAESE